MDVKSLVRMLDEPNAACQWLEGLGIADPRQAHANLVSIAESGLTLDLVAAVCRQLEQHLSETSDPAMSLNNLDRYIIAARNPLALGSLIERDLDALPTLLQIFSTSQYLSDLLIRDPESFDLLRLTEGQPVSYEILAEEILSEVTAASDRATVVRILRRYKQRETLRIAYGDIVRGQQINTVTRQISNLADAICNAALFIARRDLELRYGTPRLPDGRRARFVVLALGKLGGAELNYSSDIDLILLSDGEGKTDGQKATTNGEFFSRLSRDLVKLLTEQTELGAAYRVDLRLRPEGGQGPPVVTLDGALHYYDVSGRTWERQAFVKARAIAGDLDLGQQFLKQLEPWVYRQYLNRADITGIKALKRRIEVRTRRAGDDDRNIKTGNGGIRDIEFVIQFLQLLNGGDLAELRTSNTLEAIDRLERVGCLTLQERSLLSENYARLRKIEHRLQILFDLQTHSLPASDTELHRLALRTGYRDGSRGSALDEFRADLEQRKALNRKILNHLLHDAFADDAQEDPETDLVLDPNPSPDWIRECLERYGFQDVAGAYKNLMALSMERIAFLSTRRCRHFLASIARRLLVAISQTPDPDATLVNLGKVSDSVGGKGILWELFSFNPPTLQLYVQLCASSPYLSGILTSNPGMLDELMDSLVLDRLPSLEMLNRQLSELCRGAEDSDMILHSFKMSQHLRIGVRDILGKDDIRDTHRTLSDVAEACINQIANAETNRLVERFGIPSVGSGPREGESCELVILGLGKLGGREPNYHSDVDVIFLYEEHGTTRHPADSRRKETTSNQHFFSQLCQRIIKVMSHLGPQGRLYELDPRLRPTGKSGALAVSVTEFERYFQEGAGQLWERQALCKARPLFASESAGRRTMDVVRRIVADGHWDHTCAESIRKMRQRLEDSASPQNIKRGAGGTVDIEFLVQMLQLAAVNESPEVLVPGTLDAIESLGSAGKLGIEDAQYLCDSYRFLRSIESGLRLMNTTARHDIPEDIRQLEKLAYLLNYPSADQLIEQCDQYRRRNRELFDRVSYSIAVN